MLTIGEKSYLLLALSSVYIYVYHDHRWAPFEWHSKANDQSMKQWKQVLLLFVEPTIWPPDNATSSVKRARALSKSADALGMQNSSGAIQTQLTFRQQIQLDCQLLATFLASQFCLYWTQNCNRSSIIHNPHWSQASSFAVIVRNFEFVSQWWDLLEL